MRAIVPLVLIAATALGACQQTPPPVIRTGEGMIDPATGALFPEFVDTTLVLSFTVEERLGQPLSNTDRREIDAALLRTASDNPGAGPQVWANSIRGHRGSVDLTTLRIDSRAGELCATFNHDSQISDKTLVGAITFCRASIDPAWRIDEVTWREPVRTSTVRRTTPRRTPPPAPTVVVPPSTSGGGTTVVVPPSTGGGNFGVGTGPSTPPPPPPSGQNCEVPTGGGAVTLGDCLAPG